VRAGCDVSALTVTGNSSSPRDAEAAWAQLVAAAGAGPLSVANTEDGFVATYLRVRLLAPACMQPTSQRIPPSAQPVMLGAELVAVITYRLRMSVVRRDPAPLPPRRRG
jgi:hypothetical protein